jgi:hypothetical protein
MVSFFFIFSGRRRAKKPATSQVDPHKRRACPPEFSTKKSWLEQYVQASLDFSTQR